MYNKMKKRTTLQIEKETLNELFKAKSSNKETYDQLMRRLLKVLKCNKRRKK